MIDRIHTADISIADDGTKVTITGKGSLDFINAERFGEGLKRASVSAENVVVDLSSADFIDTAILEYLARAGTAMLRRGKRLKVVVQDGSHPLRVLQITDLTDLVDIEVKPTGA